MQCASLQQPVLGKIWHITLSVTSSTPPLEPGLGQFASRFECRLTAQPQQSRQFDHTQNNSGKSVPGLESRRRPKVKALTTGVAKPPRKATATPAPENQKRLRTQSPTEVERPRERPLGRSTLLNTTEQSDDPFSHFQPTTGETVANFRALTDEERNFIDRMTSSAELDAKHSDYARELGEVNGDDYRHLALCGNIARTQFYLFQISQQVPTLAEQVAEQFGNLHQDLTDKMNVISANVDDRSEAVHSGVIRQAPTATSTSTATSTATSTSTSASAASAEAARTATVSEWKASRQLKLRVAKQDAEWVALHLPKQIRGVNNGEGLRKYATAIRDSGKHARKKLHLLLLTNVHNQKHGVVKGVAVPTLMALWHQIALKCGLIGGDVDAIRSWRAADEVTRGRIAYLRRKATRLRQTPSATNIWSEVEKQLDVLRDKEKDLPDYTTSFYDIIYQNDIEIFNGKRSWSEIKENYVITLPTEDAIIAGTSEGVEEAVPPLGGEGDGEDLLARDSGLAVIAMDRECSLLGEYRCGSSLARPYTSQAAVRRPAVESRPRRGGLRTAWHIDLGAVRVGATCRPPIRLQAWAVCRPHNLAAYWPPGPTRGVPNSSTTTTLFAFPSTLCLPISTQSLLSQTFGSLSISPHFNRSLVPILSSLTQFRDFINSILNVLHFYFDSFQLLLTHCSHSHSIDH
ncbi:uncharacterized protein MELLADRAFT_93968 [Melampsora larici-populina 98AG31]|uniref:Uncharacterized protein n=1 Tax=Melampsora larici-populina (strain 98AG31 / pathotype 3-4-7) TaxID=747676 RepID=F4S5X8_MELLP|nr:uncharacterized protein MELLADRAFT_93968 [Melampsora larici-populina 98AG31]EGF99980.1 hypothetical protein MELLADRAFT_93968 [Melampsora larici-populina 98AG31]